MLSQSIDNAAHVAAQIAGSGKSGGPAIATAQHASNFINSEVPVLHEFQARLSEFASEAVGVVNDMLNKISSGTKPETLINKLLDVKGLLSPISSQADEVESQMGSFRTIFASDVASLNTYVAGLKGQVAKYNSLRQHYQQEANSIRKRLDTINAISYVPIFGPIVKLGSEVESLIASGKLTEQQLSDANRQYSAYAAQEAQAQSVAASASSMGSQTLNLANSVQNARNSITIAEGKLENEDAFLSQTNKQNALLFLNALKSSFTQLQSIAA